MIGPFQDALRCSQTAGDVAPFAGMALLYLIAYLLMVGTYRFSVSRITRRSTGASREDAPGEKGPSRIWRNHADWID